MGRNVARSIAYHPAQTIEKPRAIDLRARAGHRIGRAREIALPDVHREPSRVPY